MNDVVTWSMNQYVAMGVMLGVFGFIGLLRGVRRELYASVAILLAALVVGATSGTLAAPVNRFFSLFRLAYETGLNPDQMSESWARITAEPPLIESPQSQNALRVALFATIVLVGYLLGERFGPIPFGIAPRLIGLFIGLFNGFGITYFVLPIVFPEPRALIEIPTGEVQETLVKPEFLAQLAILFIFVMIAYGLYSATGRNARKRE